MSGLSLTTLLVLAVFLALIIIVAGTYLAREADAAATTYSFSAGLVGAVLLGAATSLPGTVVSISAAVQGNADLAIANAIGGITAQTAFLAVADIIYRRQNLEHAAASIATIMQSALLVILLALPLVASAIPEIRIGHIHAITPLMVLVYISGLRLIDRAEAKPRWRLSGGDDAGEGGRRVLQRKPIWPLFAGLVLVTGIAGYLIGETAVEMSVRTGLSITALGVLATAIITSLPELVTSIAAVRRGALALAVGGIIGGNAYDVLFLSFSDLAYLDGSIYSELSDQHIFLLAISIIMSAVLLLGLVKRDPQGPANIGFESTIILALYAVTILLLVSSQP